MNPALAPLPDSPLPGTDDIWCVIPVFNNAATVVAVAAGCRRRLRHVVVVDDGSTDAPIAGLLAGADVTVLRHDRNLGKGRALLTGLRYVHAQGGRFMITLDADGQHDPADIPAFIPLIRQDPDSIVIGVRDFRSSNVPRRSRFGRVFSNFWVRLETGALPGDSQSGFRAYPVEHLVSLGLRGNRFDFEIDALVKGAWVGLALQTVNVSVSYPPPAERVSHFRPGLDNLLISLRHAALVGRRLIPWPHRKRVRRPSRLLAFLRHPGTFVATLLTEHGTPEDLAASAAVGVFIATLPCLGFHTVLILYFTTRLNLNRLMAVTIQNLCMPPFVPALCIELGHFMRHRRWLTEASLNTLVYEMHHRVWEWLLGSLVLAPLLAAIAAGVVFAATRWIQRKRQRSHV